MKGHVRPLKKRPGYYIAEWYLGTDDRGRKRKITKTFKATGKRDADRQGTEILAELAKRADDIEKQRGTVAEYADRWLARKRRELSPATIQGGYQPIIKRIKQRFGRMQLDALTSEHVKEWYHVLGEQGLSARTVERHHQVLRAMYREAAEDGRVTKIPTAFRRAKIGKPTLRVPDEETVATLLRSAGDGDFGVLLRLAVLTGMRRGELVGLRWSDIEAGPEIDGLPTLRIRVERSVLELKGGKLAVKTTKTGEARTVMIVGADTLLLVEHRRRKGKHVTPASYVFAADMRGMTPRRPGWVTQRWRRLRAEFGLEGVRLHDLRHFHATRLLAAGVPINDVSRRLGHSKTSTTLDIYGHATSAGEIEAAKAARLTP